jgi:putative FmdB family regulatory protein
MALYDYECEACGPFRAWRPMSEWDQDADCPSCSRASKRSIAMPRLRCVSPSTRIAHERNERSAEEPRVMRREELNASRGATPSAAHRHGRNMYRTSVLGHVH